MSATANKIAVAVSLIMLAFFPSLFAELSYVDDLDVYRWIASSDISLKTLFYPNDSGGGYYRPLIGISYLFDKHVWFLDTRLMHLDNLLFHIVNSLLIYYLACQLLPSDQRQQNRLPLVASLLFGLHPLTTESVAWISGRTDIMAGTFVLMSAGLLLKYRNTGKLSILLLAVAVLIPGLLIKETPLAFLLGGLFILSASRDESRGNLPAESTSYGALLRAALFSLLAAVLLLITYNVWSAFLCGLAYLCYELWRDYRAGKRFQARMVLLVAACTALPVSLFFLIRGVVFTSSIKTFGNTVKLIAGDLNYAGQTFFGAAGFYLRKFIFPFPLNFAIREIDPMYNPLGVIVFIFCLYAIRRRSINSAFFLAGVCLILPALPLSLGTITWTAYAERYVYMSTAFWALSICLWLGSKADLERYRPVVPILVTILLLVMGVSTFQRCITWKTNLALLGDTVTKTPVFRPVRMDYMLALMAHGDLEGAKAQYRKAKSIPGVEYLELLDLNMAAIYALEGKRDEAEKLYSFVLKKTLGKSVKAYQAYISFLHDEYAASIRKNDGSAIAVGVKLAENMEKLYKLNKQPMLLYSAGQLSLALGKCGDASRLFSLAAKAFPSGSEYGLIAARLVNSLADGHCKAERR